MQENTGLSYFQRETLSNFESLMAALQKQKMKAKNEKGD